MERAKNVDPESNQPSGVENAGNGPEGIGPSSRLPELHESMDPEPTKRKGRYNLRTSLAWDTAFFTSAGVLDAEELSTMITGTDEAAKNSLARIEEDITGSTESISSFQSDNLTLDSHEDDLFVDIRASIQRSSKRPPSFMNSISKMPDEKVLNEAVSFLKEEDSALQCKNPKMASKVSGLQTVRMAKCQPKQISGKPGSGKTQSQVTQVKSIAQNVPSTSVLRKPPNTIAKTIPNSTATVKRGSIGSAHEKPEGRSLKAAIASSKGVSPKVQVATGVGRVFSKPAGFSKTSSVGSSTSSTTQLARLSASSDSSSSISSKASAKSIAVTVKRNPVKPSNVVTRTLGSVTKPPSKAAVKDRQATSKLSAYMKSTKTSTIPSPASSISEWSSVSSSSSIVNPRSHNPRTSFDASSCKSMDSDITVQDSMNQFANASVDGRKSQEIDFPGDRIKKAPAQTGGLQAPMKPSGLRLPSPKIGFFDGVKSNTPKRAPPSQFGLRSSLSKAGAVACSPKQSSNTKPKSSNVPTATTVTDLLNTKPASLKSISLASSKKKLHASANDSLTFSSGAKYNATRQNYHVADEVQFGELNQVMDTSMRDSNKNVDCVEIVTDQKNMGVEVGNSVSLPAPGLESVCMGGAGDAFVSQNLPANNATGENYKNVDEVGAANQVMDTVMSAIEDNFVKLQKETEHNTTDVGVMKIATVAESYKNVDEVGAANQVMDTVMSAIEDNFVKLQKETEQNTTDVRVMQIATVAESNSSGLDEFGLNMSTFPEGTDSGRALVSQTHPANNAIRENYHSADEVVGSEDQVIDTVMNESQTHPANDAINENYHSADEVEVGSEDQVIDTVHDTDDSLFEINNEAERNNTDVVIMNIVTEAESSISVMEYTVLKADDGLALISQNHQENKADEDEIRAANQMRDTVLSAINDRLVGLKKETELNDVGAGITDVAENSTSGWGCIGQEESWGVLVRQKHPENDEIEGGSQTQVLDAVMSAINEKLVELKKEVEQNTGIGIMDSPVAESSMGALDCIGQEGGGVAYLDNTAVGKHHDKSNEVEASSQVIDAVMSAITDKLVDLKKEVEQNNMSDVVMDVATVAESSTSGLKCIGQEGDISASISQNHPDNNANTADEAEVVAANQVINAVMSAIDDKLLDFKKETEQEYMAFEVMDIATVSENKISGLECASPKRIKDTFVSQNYLDDDSYETSESSDKENGPVEGYDRIGNPNYCGPVHEVLSEIQDSVVSFPVKSSKSPYQSPFTVENIPGNGERMTLTKESDVLSETIAVFGLLSLEKNESC